MLQCTPSTTIKNNKNFKKELSLVTCEKTKGHELWVE
jgi:hypothetical protein